MAKEYEKLANELQEKARENLQLIRFFQYTNIQSAVAFMSNKINVMREEEQATQKEARSAILAVESGVHSLHDRLSKEEIARSEVAQRMEQTEARLRQARVNQRLLFALHEELGEPSSLEAARRATDKDAARA